MSISALILAKSKSNRLPNKNTLPFRGEPMFLANVRKCLRIFDKVYVSSDSDEILNQAQSVGAIPIKRGEDLCGDVPNIPVYQHALDYMDCANVVAVQANSPTVDSRIISSIKYLIEQGYDEIMTCDRDYKIYGSVWALSRTKLLNYKDPRNPKPNILVMDTSIDVHDLSDYNKIT